MRILDVLREQEEPAALSASEQLKDLYDKLKSDNVFVHMKHSGDENDNFIFSNLSFKMEYEVLELECTIYYTIRDFNTPKKVDNDIAVNVFKDLQNYMNKKFKLDSYGDDLLDNIIFSIREIAIMVNSKDLAKQTLQLTRILSPIATKFTDGVKYTFLKDMGNVISRYQIPEEFTVFFEDNFNEENKRIYKRIQAIYSVLKQGSVDGHSYHFKGFPWISIDPFKTHSESMVFNKIEGKKVIPADFRVSVSAYPSLLEIDGEDGGTVELNNPALYKKVRAHIAKLFNHHKIKDSYTP